MEAQYKTIFNKIRKNVHFYFESFSAEKVDPMAKIKKRVSHAIKKYSSKKPEGEEGVIDIEFFDTGAVRVITRSLETDSKREMFFSKQSAEILAEELKFYLDKQIKF